MAVAASEFGRTRTWDLIFKDDNGYAGIPGGDSCCPTGQSASCGTKATFDVLFLMRSTKTLSIVTSGDSGVHLYDIADGKVNSVGFASPEDLELERPGGIAANSDGSLIAIGDLRQRDKQGPIRLRVVIVDSKTLKSARAPLEVTPTSLNPDIRYALQVLPYNSDLRQTSLERVAWLKTNRGEYIFAAGTFPCILARADLLTDRERPTVNGHDMCMARWQINGDSDDPHFLYVGNNRVMGLTALPLRQGLAIASNSVVEIVTEEGVPLVTDGRTFILPNDAVDFRDSSLDFDVSPDGKVVKFRPYSSEAQVSPIFFQLGDQEIIVGPEEQHHTTTFPPDRDADKTVLKDWKNQGPNLARIVDRPFSAFSEEFHPEEVFRSVSLLAADKRLLLGSNNFLRFISYTNDTFHVLCRLPVEEDAYRVNLIKRAGALIAISAHGDGTLRWHRINPDEFGCTFESLLTVRFSELGPHKWGWIAWRDSGEFFESLDQNDELEWQFIDKSGQVRVTPLARMLDKWNPSVVGKALEERPADVDESEVIKRTNILELDSSDPPPERVDKAQLELNLKVRDGVEWPSKLDVRSCDDGAGLEKIYNGNTIPEGDWIMPGAAPVPIA